MIYKISHPPRRRRLFRNDNITLKTINLHKQTIGFYIMWVRIKIIYVFLSVILFNSSGFSQLFPVLGNERIDNLTLLPQGYMLPNLSGYGYSKTIGDVSNIGNMNPASLTFYNSISGGISYQYDSKIDEAWIADLGYAKNKYGLPQSAGFVYPYRNIRLGIGFNQKINQSLIEKDEPVRTTEHPEGTGEYFSTIQDFNILSCSFSLAWSVKNRIVKEDKLSIGLRYELNMLNVYEQIWHFNAKGQFYSSSYALGLTYEGLSKDDFNYKVSLFFEKGVRLSGVLRTSYDYLYPNNITTTGKTPDKINAGLDFNMSSPLRISTNFCYVLWHNVGDADNQAEVSLSALYNYSEIVSFSFGTYFIRYNSPFISNFFGAADKLNAVYLSAGTVIHYGQVDFNFGLADSHLMSGNWRKQTVGMVALSFHL